MSMTYNQAIGATVRMLRKEVKMTQRQAGALCSVEAAAWSNRERGITPITAHEIRVFCLALDILPGYVFKHADKLLQGGCSGGL